MPPLTPKKRTTNLKTKNNQNWLKIKLYGSLTTKKLKKTHSSRLVGGADTGTRGEEGWRQGSGWQSEQPHICVQINQEEQLGSETDCATQVSTVGKYSLKTYDWKNLWGLRQREKLPALQESSLERSTRSYNLKNPPNWKSAPEGPNLLVGSWRSDIKLAESWTSCTVPSLPTPPLTVSQHSDVGCPTLANT